MVNFAKECKILFLLLIVGFVVEGQGSSHIHDSIGDLRDTVYYKIQLINSSEPKVVKYDFGRNAIIYLGFTECVTLCKQFSENDMEGGYKDLLKLLDSAEEKKDTIEFDEFNSELENISSELFKEGNAWVFDKQNGVYVNTISYRLEKYGEQGWLFYYFTDLRPILGIMEYSGIIESGHLFLDSATLSEHYSEYIKLGEKLRESGK